MNSLTYISRQLQDQDGLGQPQTSSHLKRSETWSKPFHFRRRGRKPLIRIHDSSSDSSEDSLDNRPTVSRKQAHRKAKRSFSSPALLDGSSVLPSVSSSRAPSTPKPIPMTACSNPVHSAAELIKKESYLYRRLRHLPLSQAFVLIWNSICATFEHWLPSSSSTKQTSLSGKDSDDEALAMSLVTQAPESDSESKEDIIRERKVDYDPQNLSPKVPFPSSRESSPTPTSTPPPVSLIRRPTPFHQPKTLVLDLDETLIHSTIRPMRGSSGLFGFEFGGNRLGKGHVVEVLLNGRRTKYHVYKRPFVDYFLRKVSSWYTIVIFTASMQEYADPVIDWLDAGKGVLERRFFRDSCTPLPSGSYSKDLALVEEDLSRVCLVDNSPVCYSVNPANAIPIEGWTHDLSDEALLDLLPVLDSLRFTNDVRRVLGLRGFI